jgi:hypothetical protein
VSGIFLVVLAIIAFYVGWFIYLKRRAAAISAAEYVEVSLDVASTVEIGSKASGSLLHRLAKSGGKMETASKPEIEPIGVNAFEWRVKSKGGVLLFQVTPSEGRSRVECWADEIVIAQHGTSARGIFALGFAITNALYRSFGIPRDPGGLIRCRKRVFNAVMAADGRPAEQAA